MRDFMHDGLKLAAFGLALLALPGLSGCAPDGIAAAGANFGSSLNDNVSRGATNVGGLFKGAPDDPAYSTPIFIASTRKGGVNATELTPGAKARYALDFVTVPPGHKAGSIERPNFGAPDPQKHFAVAGHRQLDDEAFRGEIAAHLSGRIGVNRDVLVYVHGFNTSMEEARFRLAQVVVDGKFGGVPVLFTWPSKSTLLAYGADKESATASRDAYLKLLTELSETPGIGRIHILAHSMGTWLTMEALREAALSGSPDLHGKLGDVQLAAPDIDLSVFKAQMARLDPSHFAVFVSKGDRALQISAGIQGDRRLGSIDPGNDQDREMIEKLGVKVFDISDLSTSLIGHDSYADSPQAVRQIGAAITAPRAAESGEQAVIDAGADRTPQPPAAAPGAITATDLPALGAAAPVEAGK
jgi:esterase/lipase superfamily enzyme